MERKSPRNLKKNFIESLQMGLELGPKSSFFINFHFLLHQNVDFCPFKIVYTSKWQKVAQFLDKNLTQTLVGSHG